MNSYKLQILETHLDSFGHVNNAAYLEIFEEARWDLITKNNYGIKEIHQSKQGPVILEVNLKFLRELRNREWITVTTEVIEYKGKVGKLLQKMILPDGTVASEATFTFGLFDLGQRKLIEPTAAWKKAVGI